AWSFLVGMILVEFSIWGFGVSYGVLLDYYIHSDLGKDKSSNYLLPLVGTVNTGTMSSMIPVLAIITNRFPGCKRFLMALGLVCIVLSLFLSSYSTKPIHVLLTLGVGYGMSGIAMYYPCLSYLPSWFQAKKGLAYGVVCAANGLGGLIFPIITEHLLKHVGLASALKYLSLIIGAICSVGLFLTKPRVEENYTKGFYENLGDLGALKNWYFWVILFCNTIQALSYFIPGLFLPNYAHTLSLSQSSATILLSVLNVSNVFSKSILGSLSDYISPHLIGCLTHFVAAAGVLGIWGGLGAHGMVSLVPFSLIFGLTAGAWTSFYFSMIYELTDDENTTMTLFVMISVTRGIGNIVSGVISSTLLRFPFEAPRKTGFQINNSHYSSLILFCGIGSLGTSAVEWFLYVK
ncbi:major facilitator superfamily domain-containing protein, partial [Phakopsora pachyrhizi]